MNEDNIKVYYDNRFIMVNYDVIMSGQLTAYEIAVYVALCAFANHHDHSCYPSYTTLAEKAGCSRSTAIRTIASLLEKGLIEKKTQVNADGEYQSNVYVICTNSNHPKREAAQQCHIDNNSGVSDTPDHTLNPAMSSDEYPCATTAQTIVVAPGNEGGVRAKPKLDSFNYITKKEDDEEDIRREIQQKIEYDYFCREMPDRIGFVDTLIDAIVVLQQEDKPEQNSLLRTVNSSVILEFMDEFKSKPIGHVHNYTAWLRTVFIDYLRKQEAFRKDFW